MAQDARQDAVADTRAADTRVTDAGVTDTGMSTPEAAQERRERAESEEGRFNFNTLAMAGLAVIFVVFSVSLLSGILYDQHLDEFGYPVEVVDAAPVVEDEGPAYDPVLPLLASADPAAGESIFRRCSSCHAAGDENKVGPGLGGVVNRAIAGHPGFGYSGALQAHAAEAPAWTYEELNGFLWKPKTWVPGTSMGFAGLSDVQERANVIAYLRQISGDPPLPTEEEIAAVLATEEVAEDAAAVDATADGAIGDAGTDGAPLATDTVDGQGVPGNEAIETPPGDEVVEDAVIVDEAVVDEAVVEETPVAPVTPGLAEPEVEGVIVDPAPDAAIVVPDETVDPAANPVVDPTAPVIDPVAPVVDPVAPVVAPEEAEGGVRSYTVPIE